MKIELTRFKVKKGKSKKVNAWMKLLKDNLPAVLRTLEDERMYVENIFRETVGSSEYLYWYSIQGNGGVAVEKSKHDIDKLHLKYWKECIVPKSGKDMILEVTMIPKRIKQSMK